MAGGLDDAVRRLVDAGLLYPRGLAPDVVYVFHHALVQDAAYDSILRSTRQQFHRAIAATLEERRTEAGLGDAPPEVIGHHCAAAGLEERAVAAYLEAGRRAIAVSGHREAVAHLRLALDLVATLPAGQERDRTELCVRLALGAPMAAMLGYAASDVEANYTRAGELLAGRSDPAWGEAEAEMATALDVARRQGARALEERARTALDGLRQRRSAGTSHPIGLS